MKRILGIILFSLLFGCSTDRDYGVEIHGYTIQTQTISNQNIIIQIDYRFISNSNHELNELAFEWTYENDEGETKSETTSSNCLSLIYTSIGRKRITCVAKPINPLYREDNIEIFIDVTE